MAWGLDKTAGITEQTRVIALDYGVVESASEGLLVRCWNLCLLCLSGRRLQEGMQVHDCHDFWRETQKPDDSLEDGVGQSSDREMQHWNNQLLCGSLY